MKVQFYPDDIDSDVIEVPDDITEEELYDMACEWVANNVPGFSESLAMTIGDFKMNNTYIKLDDAVRALDKEWSGCSFDGSGNSISDRCEDVLMELPSIQIKFAKWVKARGSWCTPGGDPVWECSNCGMGRHVYGIEHGTYNSGVSDGQWKACPNCMAIMER